ncbi:MAG: ZIP family metal transporter [Candidatus Aenigmatarchaeota archaeon]
MSFLSSLLIVFVAGLITALATALGAVPFFIFDEISDRWTVALWGVAGGIMLSASFFGLILKGISNGAYVKVGAGLLLGALLVEFAGRMIHDYEFAPREIAEADFAKLVLILGVLTVHSFPEGVAIGVAFADLGVKTGVLKSMTFLGLTVPLLGIFMTLAISIQNVPEGLAVSIPLHSFDYSKTDMVKASIFSSLPQPLGAVIAFYFVSIARDFLPIGFGFAAGAMIFLVYEEMVPEALEQGENLPRSGLKYIVAGLLVGFISMSPFALFL